MSSSGGGVARGAGMAALMGAGLIALAVIIGIVLLQVVDDGSVNPKTVESQPSNSTTTTTKPKGNNSTSSSVPSTPAKTPSELRYLVLNGGAATGAAGDLTDALRLKGYTNNGDANDWTGHTQTGNTVLCQDGMSREASALAVAVGEGTQTEAWPTPAPPFSDGMDCVVVVGK